MKKVGIVIRKEYSERVTSAGFIITTILIPVLMISVIAIPILIQLFSSKSDVRVAIIDKTKALKADLTEVFSSVHHFRLFLLILLMRKSEKCLSKKPT